MARVMGVEVVAVEAGESSRPVVLGARVAVGLVGAGDGAVEAAMVAGGRSRPAAPAGLEAAVVREGREATAMVATVVAAKVMAVVAAEEASEVAWAAVEWMAACWATVGEMEAMVPVAATVAALSEAGKEGEAGQAGSQAEAAAASAPVAHPGASRAGAAPVVAEECGAATEAAARAVPTATPARCRRVCCCRRRRCEAPARRALRHCYRH